MISKTDALINKYESVVREPWDQKLSGQEKVWFLVYDPTEQRKILFRLPDFERVTLQQQKGWKEVDLADCFPRWMSKHKYREKYFEQPEFIKDTIERGFKEFVVKEIKETFQNSDNIYSTVFALININAIFGFIKLSEVLQEIYHFNEGRLLVFFPGEYQNNQYRLMGARDGWSYLARPIIS